MRSATVTPAPNVRELKAAAVQRQLARWTPPRFETTDGPARPARRLADETGELKAPVSLASGATSRSRERRAGP